MATHVAWPSLAVLWPHVPLSMCTVVTIRTTAPADIVGITEVITQVVALPITPTFAISPAMLFSSTKASAASARICLAATGHAGGTAIDAGNLDAGIRNVTDDPELEFSPLCGRVIRDGVSVRVEIYRLAERDEGWSLEVIDEDSVGRHVRNLSRGVR
jgi:hypothetical protein